MNDRGTASLELALGMAVLVVPAVVAVLAFAPWLEARSLARAAAAESARAAVLADGDNAAVGEAVALEVARGRGLKIDAFDVTMCGGDGCVLTRDGFVTSEVTVNVPLIVTPWGAVGGVVVTATHVEPVDAYRSLP